MMANSPDSRFSVSNILVPALLKLSSNSLNKNEKRGLVSITEHGLSRTYTLLAKELSCNLEVCLSTSWNIIRRLKSFELIFFDVKENGIVLTSLGKLIYKAVKND
jgi:hypothetical protein